MQNPLAPDKAITPTFLQPSLHCLANVKESPLQWLWHGRIALGKLNLLVAPPGLGKSCLALDIAARLSAGRPWPDDPETPRSPGGVLLVTDQATLADTAIPRLKAAGADLQRINALTSLKPDPFLTDSPPIHDLARLEEAIQSTPDCRLLLVDPILRAGPHYVTAGQMESRFSMSQLGRLAASRNLALLATAPVKNARSAQMLLTTVANLSYNQLAGTIWTVARDNQQPDRRILLSLKSTLTHDTPALAFHITAQESPHIPHLVWDELPVTTSLEDAFDTRHTLVNRKEVSQWLESLLADGPVPASDILEQARDDGITHSLARNALVALGGVRYRKGFGARGQWLWALNAEPPEEEANSQPSDSDPPVVKEYIDDEEIKRWYQQELDEWLAEEGDDHDDDF